MPLTKEQLIKLGELHKEIASIYLSVATEETKEVVAEVEEVETNEEVVEESTEDVEETVEEAEESDDIQEGKDAVDLEGMSYNDLKKLAKELNLSAKGTKSELVDRIKEAQGILVVDEDEAEDEEVEIEEPVEEVEDVEESEEDLETSLHEKVASDLEDYSDEELKEILESIDKPTKGKRQTLIALIVQAIEDGELDFGDEEEEEEVEEDNDETNDEVEEISDETEDEEELDLEDILSDLDRDQIKAICRKLDIKVMKKDTAETLATKVMEYEDENSLLDVLVDLGYVNLDNEEQEEEEEETQEPNFIGSKERVKAMKKVYRETLEDIKEGTIKAKDVTKFLKEYHNDTWQGTQDENNKEYARIKAELVDDEGDSVSLEEAYYVGDDVYCCGAKLKELDGDYYCEFCGTEYEA